MRLYVKPLVSQQSAVTRFKLSIRPLLLQRQWSLSLSLGSLSNPGCGSWVAGLAAAAVLALIFAVLRPMIRYSTSYTPPMVAAPSRLENAMADANTGGEPLGSAGRTPSQLRRLNPTIIKALPWRETRPLSNR